VSITIFIGLDMGSDIERFIPVIWDKDEIFFLRDNDKEIKYNGSSCVVDENNDNQLA